MGTTNSKVKSLLSRGKVAKLGKGIHDNVVVTNIDIVDRKKNGMPTKKNVFITFATVDPKTRKKKAETELSWWKLDPKSEFFFDNLREMLIQMHGILTAMRPEDEVLDAMGDIFNDWDFESVDDIKDAKWKKADLEKLVDNIKTKFAETAKDFVGLDSKALMRVKITTDKKGEYTEMPKYGVFTESMDVEDTSLRFSDAELRMHSNGGTVQGNGGSASSKLSSL